MPRKQCKTGKDRYRTELDAKIVLVRIQGKAIKHRKNGKQDKMPIRTYLCPMCGGHHLTSQPKHEQESIS